MPQYESKNEHGEKNQGKGACKGESEKRIRKIGDKDEEKGTEGLEGARREG